MAYVTISIYRSIMISHKKSAGLITNPWTFPSWTILLLVRKVSLLKSRTSKLVNH